MSSSNQQSKKVINVDDLTPSFAPTRSRRGGRLMSLGSTPCRGSSYSHVTPPSSSRSIVSLSSPRARSSRSSSKGREHNEPLREPRVDEIVPVEFSFAAIMGTVENVSDFHDRVEKILLIAHFKEHSWKYLSGRFG